MHMYHFVILAHFSAQKSPDIFSCINELDWSRTFALLRMAYWMAMGFSVTLPKSSMSTHIKGGSPQVPNFGIFQVWHLAKLDLPFSTPTPLKINKGEFAPSLPSRSVAMRLHAGSWCQIHPTPQAIGPEQIITTSAEVTLNGGLVRESPQNPLNSGLGIILMCPELDSTCLLETTTSFRSL